MNLAPAIWDEVYVFARSLERFTSPDGRVDDYTMMMAVNHIVNAIQYPDTEWITEQLNATADEIISNIVDFMPNVDQADLAYFADYVTRVVDYYLENPSYFAD